ADEELPARVPQGGRGRLVQAHIDPVAAFGLHGAGEPVEVLRTQVVQSHPQPGVHCERAALPECVVAGLECVANSTPWPTHSSPAALPECVVAGLECVGQGVEFAFVGVAVHVVEHLVQAGCCCGGHGCGPFSQCGTFAWCWTYP